MTGSEWTTMAAGGMGCKAGQSLHPDGEGLPAVCLSVCLDESLSDPLFPNKLDRKQATGGEQSLMRSVESICY